MINPGERVLITGKRGGDNTSFFSAIAGLWPWGCGRILLPPAQTMQFILPKHYIPPGTLRNALAYPSQPSQFTSEDYIAVLERTELAHLAPDLDRVASWERELTSEEQQKCALARVLLRKPRWIVLDQAIDHIDEDTRGLVLEVCGQELADAAIVNVGEANTQGGFFTRVLHLIEDPLGQGLAPCAAASMPEPTAKQKAPTI